MEELHPLSCSDRKGNMRQIQKIRTEDQAVLTQEENLWHPFRPSTLLLRNLRHQTLVQGHTANHGRSRTRTWDTDTTSVTAALDSSHGPNLGGYLDFFNVFHTILKIHTNSAFYSTLPYVSCDLKVMYPNLIFPHNSWNKMGAPRVISVFP